MRTNMFLFQGKEYTKQNGEHFGADLYNRRQCLRYTETDHPWMSKTWKKWGTIWCAFERAVQVGTNGIKMNDLECFKQQYSNLSPKDFLRVQTVPQIGVPQVFRKYKDIIGKQIRISQLFLLSFRIQIPRNRRQSTKIHVNTKTSAIPPPRARVHI